MFDDLHDELWDTPKITNIGDGFAVRMNRSHDGVSCKTVFWPKFEGNWRVKNEGPAPGPVAKHLSATQKELVGISAALCVLRTYGPPPSGVQIIPYLQSILEENRESMALSRRLIKGGLTRESFDISIGTWAPGKTSIRVVAHVVDTGLELLRPYPVIVGKGEDWDRFYAQFKSSEEMQQVLLRVSRQYDARKRIAKRFKQRWPLDIYDQTRDRVYSHPVSYNYRYRGATGMMNVQSALPRGHYLIALMPPAERGRLIRKFMEEMG